MTRKNRLERALDALSRERQLRQIEMAQISSRREQITTSIQQLKETREATISTAVVDNNGHFSPSTYLVARTAEARMSVELDQLGSRLEKFDHEITDVVQDRLRASAVREKAVETLLTKQKAVAQRALEKREIRQMDECAQNRWRKFRFFGRK